MTNEQPQVKSNNHGDSSFWVGMFLGGIIGALIIVILGTDKGKKLAKKLQDEGLDFWDETKDKLSDRVEELQEKVSEVEEKGKELLEKGKVIEQEIVEKVTDAKDTMTQEAVAKADAALAHIEQLQERGRQSTAELRKRLFKNIPRKTS